MFVEAYIKYCWRWNAYVISSVFFCDSDTLHVKLYPIFYTNLYLQLVSEICDL